MRHLFSHEGEVALAVNLRRKPLLAFDFDGTLAPIVSRPQYAQASRAVAFRLSALVKLLPVAVVTGRAIEDARGRLGFEPTYLIGNHGAQDERSPDQAVELRQRLVPFRAQLESRMSELAAAGIVVEDKGQSIALHYRLSRRRDFATLLIGTLLEPFGNSLKAFDGKMVVNVVPQGSPDKADAVHELVKRSGASCAFFAGDDVNDEPVFVSAPPTWLTVRVGRDDPGSSAQYYLDGPSETALLLDRMCSVLSRGL